MRGWIMLLVAALVSGIGWADTAVGKSYTLTFKDPVGCERQYAGNIFLETEFNQLLDGSMNGNNFVMDFWTARETVLANDQGKANLKYWVTDGQLGSKFPGNMKLICIPSSLRNEPMHQYTIGYTRTADGMIGDEKILGGTMQIGHTQTPYGPFYAHLFPFGLKFSLPHPTVTAGEQWNETLVVPLMSPLVEGTKPEKIVRTVTFVGPQQLEGKEYLVLTFEMDSGDRTCTVQQKKDGRKITISGIYRISGKSTVYFDEAAGEVYRVNIEGTCSSDTSVNSNKKKDGAGWEKVQVKFSGHVAKVPIDADKPVK